MLGREGGKGRIRPNSQYSETALIFPFTFFPSKYFSLLEKLGCRSLLKLKGDTCQNLGWDAFPILFV